MATVFMKWLEKRPTSYDRGIRILTLGRLKHLVERFLMEYRADGMNVLEIGCGTGELSRQMAREGAQVTAIDINPAMVEEAKHKSEMEGLSDRIQIERMDAARIADEMPEGVFDWVVASLVFSELSAHKGTIILEGCARVLAPSGQLILVDEVVPDRFFRKLLYYLVRIPLAILTFLLTQSQTRPLRGVESFLSTNGFKVVSHDSALVGSLCVYIARPLPVEKRKLIEVPYTRLKHKVTLRTILIDAWTLFFRVLPPYPKIQPGLYSIGDPTNDSPVLMTGNFDLTVRRLFNATDGQVDAWLMVVDSAGINVWCASGGGFLTTEKVTTALQATRVGEVTQNRDLIMPQFSATGVEGWKIQEDTQWNVHWGPVSVVDIPEYLETKYAKSESMRTVGFPLKDRLEMVSGTLGLYGLIILIPIAIFRLGIFLPTLLALLGLSYFYAIFLPWIPGRDGLAKSIPLIIIALMGFALYTLVFDPVSVEVFFNRAMGIIALAFFVGAELQGMSPLMRGEQANWMVEGPVLFALLLIYLLLPLLVGWR